MDAVTIMAIVFINAVLGFSQEYRTERTLEHLRAIAAPKATVYRDGEKVEVPARELVPGDVVALTAGCKVPADGRVLSATELFANESLLTGESMAVQKAPNFGEGGCAALRGVLSIRETASPSEIVITAVSPSGIAATERESPVRNISNAGSPRKIPVSVTARQMIMHPAAMYLLKTPRRFCRGVCSAFVSRKSPAILPICVSIPVSVTANSP